MMHSIIHVFNTSVIPYTSLDQYLSPNLNTIPNIQNMRFFCCSVYNDSVKVVKIRHAFVKLQRIVFTI